MGGEGSISGMITTFKNNRKALRSKSRGFKENDKAILSKKSLKFKEVSAEELIQIKKQLYQNRKRVKRKNGIIFLVMITFIIMLCLIQMI